MDIAALQLKMRDAFRVEAADLLAELDSSMLELESRPQDPDLLNRVFRAIHTIKGSGATAGFNEMAAFTHHVEELFDEARMGRLTITPEMIDLALQAKDLIGQLLDSDSPAALAPACTHAVEALAEFLPHKVKPSSNGQAKPGDGAAQTQRHNVFFRPHPQVFFSGTDPVNLLDELRALGQATVTARVDGVPPLESLDPEQCYLAWEVELLSALPIAKIKEVFLFVEDESEIRIESRLEPASSEAVEGGAAGCVSEHSRAEPGGFGRLLVTASWRHGTGFRRLQELSAYPQNLPGRCVSPRTGGAGSVAGGTDSTPRSGHHQHGDFVGSGQGKPRRELPEAGGADSVFAREQPPREQAANAADTPTRCRFTAGGPGG